MTTPLIPLPMPKGDVAEGGLDWTDEEMEAYARANVDAALKDLRRACAEILGHNPDTWPAHGNAPLAIASALQLAVTAARTPMPPVKVSGDAVAALEAPPEKPGLYRPLRLGDIIQMGDEFLQEDCVTWEKCTPLFKGMTYKPGVFLPVRRPS